MVGCSLARGRGKLRGDSLTHDSSSSLCHSSTPASSDFDLLNDGGGSVGLDVRLLLFLLGTWATPQRSCTRSGSTALTSAPRSRMPLSAAFPLRITRVASPPGPTQTRRWRLTPPLLSLSRETCRHGSTPILETSPCMMVSSRFRCAGTTIIVTLTTTTMTGSHTLERYVCQGLFFCWP